MSARILILVVTYNAENHILSVLQRTTAVLPQPAWQADVLVLDDASTDLTCEVTTKFAAGTQIPGGKFMLEKNPLNQGYGGNQKIGYRYAIEHQYDFVVLLHGDGQYPPEQIPALLQPMIETGADAVLGSRMRIRKNALKGRMPPYKWLGNMALTYIQNLLLGSALSEFHTGFRAYRVSALAQLPFEANYDYFGFDTDILIQFLQSGKRIAEIDIPTHYGTERCHVNSPYYALQCLWSSLLACLQARNVFYCRKFDYASPAKMRLATDK